MNSVHHVHIENKRNITDCNNYFPNATELVFSDVLSAGRTSIATTLSRIVPLKQLTKLVIQCCHFSFRKIVRILRFAPNIHTIELRTMACYQKKNDYTSIEQSEDFQLVSQTNAITHVTCDSECTIEQVKLLFALCRRLHYFTICSYTRDLEVIVRFLLDKNNPNTRHLCSLRFSRDYHNYFDKINKLLKSGELLEDYTLLKAGGYFYLWW